MTPERLAFIKEELANTAVKWLRSNGYSVREGMDASILPPPLSYACELYAHILELREKKND